MTKQSQIQTALGYSPPYCLIVLTGSLLEEFEGQKANAPGVHIGPNVITCHIMLKSVTKRRSVTGIRMRYSISVGYILGRRKLPAAKLTKSGEHDRMRPYLARRFWREYLQTRRTVSV
jgi:hypothetical protein